MRGCAKWQPWDAYTGLYAPASAQLGAMGVLEGVRGYEWAMAHEWGLGCGIGGFVVAGAYVCCC